MNMACIFRGCLCLAGTARLLLLLTATLTLTSAALPAATALPASAAASAAVSSASLAPEGRDLVRLAVSAVSGRDGGVLAGSGRHGADLTGCVRMVSSSIPSAGRTTHATTTSTSTAGTD